MVERTLAILKPDCVRSKLVGQTLARIEAAGFRILGMKMVRLTAQTAGGFYEVHRERPFFTGLVTFMSSGTCIPIALEKENAVADFRELIGATDPKDAAPGTIRKDFATSKGENIVHGSDSAENGRIEIAYFFAEKELIENQLEEARVNHRGSHPMALQHWSRTSRTIKFTNPWWSYFLDLYALPSGKGGEYHYVHTNGSSMVVPVQEDGKILLVNQYRYLLDRESLEFPCGSVKEGATYDQTAWQELAEETGYSAQILLLAGEFNPYNGITDEMCRVYIGRELRYVGENPDETEEFELVPLSPEEIDAKIRDGVVWDGMTIAAWGIVRARMEAGR